MIGLVADISPYILPASAERSGGGGGGGVRDKLAACKGSPPPKFSVEQITPLAVVVRNREPRFAAEPTVIGPRKFNCPSLAEWVIPSPTC